MQSWLNLRVGQWPNGPWFWNPINSEWNPQSCLVWSWVRRKDLAQFIQFKVLHDVLIRAIINNLGFGFGVRMKVVQHRYFLVKFGNDWVPSLHVSLHFFLFYYWQSKDFSLLFWSISRNILPLANLINCIFLNTQWITLKLSVESIRSIIIQEGIVVLRHW